MKGSLDCLACLVRQSVDVVERTSSDDAGKAEVLKEVLSTLATLDVFQPPPLIACHLHRVLRGWLGDDPYREIKERSNAHALRMYPRLKAYVRESADPLQAAVRVAIAGNVIDYRVKAEITSDVIKRTLSDSLSAPLDSTAVAAFRAGVEAADTIFYIADNAGEIAFDRLLIEELPREKVTVGVRGHPVINDATLEDARMVGLTDLVTVVDNGTDIPGTALSECSTEFRQLFDSADLIISKGQGNFETLSELDRPIYFMLLAKCPLIAREVGCTPGTMVLSNARSRLHR